MAQLVAQALALCKRKHGCTPFPGDLPSTRPRDLKCNARRVNDGREGVIGGIATDAIPTFYRRDTETGFSVISGR
ncbi:hypothetical protein [Salinihabitans flavidus]|uniref:hypothetical protein n=1 Tax=Salinihabitans flavidus TaxID=569882 RepID=UPI000B8390F1|nr:hypothetical protein [Salinihabitans flavidus]